MKIDWEGLLNNFKSFVKKNDENCIVYSVAIISFLIGGLLLTMITLPLTWFVLNKINKKIKIKVK